MAECVYVNYPIGHTVQQLNEECRPITPPPTPTPTPIGPCLAPGWITPLIPTPVSPLPTPYVQPVVPIRLIVPTPEQPASERLKNERAEKVRSSPDEPVFHVYKVRGPNDSCVITFDVERKAWKERNEPVRFGRFKSTEGEHGSETVIDESFAESSVARAYKIHRKPGTDRDTITVELSPDSAGSSLPVTIGGKRYTLTREGVFDSNGTPLPEEIKNSPDDPPGAKMIGQSPPAASPAVERPEQILTPPIIMPAPIRAVEPSSPSVRPEQGIPGAMRDPTDPLVLAEAAAKKLRDELALAQSKLTQSESVCSVLTTQNRRLITGLEEARAREAKASAEAASLLMERDSLLAQLRNAPHEPNESEKRALAWARFDKSTVPELGYCQLQAYTRDSNTGHHHLYLRKHEGEWQIAYHHAASGKSELNFVRFDRNWRSARLGKRWDDREVTGAEVLEMKFKGETLDTLAAILGSDADTTIAEKRR